MSCKATTQPKFQLSFYITEMHVQSFGSHFQMFIKFCFQQMLSESPFRLENQLKKTSEQRNLDGSVVLLAVLKHFGIVL